MTTLTLARPVGAAVAASILAAGLAQPASAGVIAVSTQAVWNFYLGAGGLTVETENFGGLANGSYPSGVAGSTANVGWSASAAGGIDVQGGIVASANPGSLVFTFSPGVRAVAGNFFGTDTDFNSVTVLYAATLSDGSGYSGIAEGASSFTGFVAQTPAASITSLTLTVTNIAGPATVFPSVDNLYFGVPAPGAVSLLAVAGMVAARRRR